MKQGTTKKETTKMNKPEKTADEYLKDHCEEVEKIVKSINKAKREAKK